MSQYSRFDNPSGCLRLIRFGVLNSCADLGVLSATARAASVQVMQPGNVDEFVTGTLVTLTAKDSVINVSIRGGGLCSGAKDGCFHDYTTRESANHCDSYGSVPPYWQAKQRSSGIAHIILAVTDNGSPLLTSYRRIILNVSEKSNSTQ